MVLVLDKKYKERKTPKVVLGLSLALVLVWFKTYFRTGSSFGPCPSSPSREHKRNRITNSVIFVHLGSVLVLKSFFLKGVF